MTQFLVAVAQMKSRVGDILANTEALLSEALELCREHPQLELIVFPEQALMGAAAYDLLLRESLAEQIDAALLLLAEKTPVPLVVGYPRQKGESRYNALGVIMPSKGLVAEHWQQLAEPVQADQGMSRGVYFSQGSEPTIVRIKERSIGLALGQDIMHRSLLDYYQEAGVEWLIHCQNTPYTIGDETRALDACTRVALNYQLGIVHCNTVGGQDSLVFQGGSAILHPQQGALLTAPLFTVESLVCDLSECQEPTLATWPKGEEALYRALTVALADYVNGNGFHGALLGLSGGIDSALTLAIAADALGAERVRAIMMPFDYTSAMSKEDAAEQAKILGVAYKEIPIRAPFDGFMHLLKDEFALSESGTTEENLQARCRGVILMALSNLHGQVVLACSNKSECAVGYSTLYGDMVGGFSVLKDVPKTWVYRLARWRNQQQDGPVIPWRVIERPPTAELAPGQLDENSLPSYDILDEILERYVENQEDIPSIIAAGLPEAEVRHVVGLIDRNEYKRQQGALGPKVTNRAFGVNRRYPVSYRW